MNQIPILVGILILSCSLKGEEERASTDFIAMLRNMVSSLPDDRLLPGATSNPQTKAILKALEQHSDTVVQMLHSADTAGTAQMAITASGFHTTDALTNILPQLNLMLDEPDLTLNVAPVLPFFGTQGVGVLSSGLTNRNPNVRAVCAVNLTWPWQSFTETKFDESFVRKYRENISPYYSNWLRALHDSEPRVGVAAAMALRFVGTNEVVLDGLERAANDPELDKSVRTSAETSIKVIKGELLSE